MNIHYDLDESRTTELGCLDCREDVESFITMTPIYLVYALECPECGEEIVRWDALGGRQERVA